MSNYIGDSIFWIDVDKVDPNPYQPRREFDEARLKDLSESIRQYGILMPLVVTRNEVLKEDGGLQTRYELIAGERRLRASKMAGLVQVPAVIRANADDARVKLELAIIENLQREDLNAVDRARAFERLVSEFGFKHAQIAAKVGKSREYVSNTLRLLALPPEMIEAVTLGKISEGHTRPLLMLSDRPEEQIVLFKEIMYKKLSVRDTEGLARRVAYDRVRKKEYLLDPNIADLEAKMTESLGTRVKIEKKENGGKVVIDFFTADDLETILKLLQTNEIKPPDHLMNKFAALQENKINEALQTPETSEIIPEANIEVPPVLETEEEVTATVSEIAEIIAAPPLDDRSKEEKVQQEEDLYSVKNFSI